MQKQQLERSQKEKIEHNILEILKNLGEDVTREGLSNTPSRVAKSYIEMLSGYYVNIDEIFDAQFFDKAINNNMVLIKNIEYKSLCEHHMLPVVGVANIAYIPKDSILGLSKFARIINAYAQRLQMQERMTFEVCSTIFKNLNCLGAAVHLSAQHYCMIMRGVKQSSKMDTYHFEGVFQEERYQTQFINAIK